MKLGCGVANLAEGDLNLTTLTSWGTFLHRTILEL